jgi:AcrR family transcriptional regulator
MGERVQVRDRGRAPADSVGDASGTSGPVSARLLSTAAELFWRRGYASTTIRELSRELGVQKASLYYHMEKKEDLLYSICVESLRHVHARTRAAIDGVTSPRERVRALIRGHIGAVLEERDKHATMLTELRSLSSERRRRIVALRREYEALVESVIRDGQRSGALRRDLSARLLALGLLDLLNWSIFWFDEPAALDPEELADALARLFLDGAAGREIGAPKRRLGEGPVAEEPCSGRGPGSGPRARSA